LVSGDKTKGEAEGLIEERRTGEVERDLLVSTSLIETWITLPLEKLSTRKLVKKYIHSVHEEIAAIEMDFGITVTKVVRILPPIILSLK